MPAPYRIPFPLSGRTQGLLRRGDTEGAYASRSEALQAVLTALVNAEYDREAAWRLLSNPRNAASAWVTHRANGKPRRDPRAYFDRGWDAAVEYVRAHPPYRDRGQVAVDIAAVAEAVEDHPESWRGRGGATDLAVIQALLGIARATGRITVDAAVRDLAVMVNCAAPTASRSLARLTAAGWLRRIRRGTATRAATYRLRSPLQHTDLDGPGGRERNTLSHQICEVLCVALAPPDADAFGWSGLGWGVGRIYAALGPEPVGTDDLAAGLALTPRTVRRHLKRLAAFDLAERQVDGWVRGRRSPAEVAREMGTAGSQQRRRQQYEVHREQRRVYLAWRGSTPGATPAPASGRRRR